MAVGNDRGRIEARTLARVGHAHQLTRIEVGEFSAGRSTGSPAAPSAAARWRNCRLERSNNGSIHSSMAKAAATVASPKAIHVHDRRGGLCQRPPAPSPVRLPTAYAASSTWPGPPSAPKSIAPRAGPISAAETGRSPRPPPAGSTSAWGQVLAMNQGSSTWPHGWPWPSPAAMQKRLACFLRRNGLAQTVNRMKPLITRTRVAERRRKAPRPEPAAGLAGG